MPDNTTTDHKEEILNLDYHVSRLCCKALNISVNKGVAARKLGVSTRTLYRFMELYDIKFDDATKLYVINASFSYRVALDGQPGRSCLERIGLPVNPRKTHKNRVEMA